MTDPFLAPDADAGAAPTAEYRVGADVFRVRARRHDLFYGHGLKLSIFAADGSLWTRASFTCDPRGPGFRACQELDTPGLLARAVARLEGGAHARLADARARGVRMGMALNALNATGPAADAS